MITDMHKYLIYGNRDEMERFFTLAQRAGFLEFIGMSHKKTLELPEDAKTILAAIKIARQHAVPPDETPLFDTDPLKLAERIIATHATDEKLQEEKRILTAEIARINIFGNFSRSELDQIEKEGKRVVQFFCMKSDLAREISLPPEVIYVGTEYDLDYFVAINRERTLYPKMIEILIDKPVGELKERLHFVLNEIAKMERELQESAKALPYLQNGLNDLLNGYHLELAKHAAAIPISSLFAIEAWVPETKVKALYGLLSGMDVQCEEIAIEPKDSIPTFLENKGPARIGEDLVELYDTPAWTDQDPSAWVLVFFAIFFAMIVSDAGYGLIYLLFGLFLRWKFKKAAGMGKRLIKLIIILGSSCIVWGVLTTNFFGIEVAPDNPLRKISFMHYLAVRKAEYLMDTKDSVYQDIVKEYPAVANASNGQEFLMSATLGKGEVLKYPLMEEFYDNIFLEFSLMVGIFHLSLSLCRYMLRNWANIGWILFMIGGYLYFPSILHATSIVNFMGWLDKPTAYAIGKQLVFAGPAIVLILALIQHRKLKAIFELTHVLQLFADVLSYLRLYALALAGMIMASTFNDMGIKLGLIGGFFVILVGHFVNMNLTIMVGVIHGLRLNFLEWYRYCFKGDGRRFNPLRLRKAK